MSAKTARERSRRTLLALACAAAFVGPVAQAQQPALGRITVQTVGTESSRGQLIALLFRSPAGFPESPKRAFAKQARPARAGSQLLVFDRVPPGEFAISLLHDEDGDFALDTGLFGKPTEGYGFSRDAHDAFSAPEYEECRMVLRAGTHLRIRIRLRY